MKTIVKQSIFGLITLLFASCSSKQVSENNSKEPTESIHQFFDEADLGAFGANTRLILDANFSECGEWGGHKEEMVIYAKVDKEFYLDYKKFKVNCDSIGQNYGKPSFQKLEFEKNLKLNQSYKESISNYIQRMIKSKIEERFPGHAGNSFSVFKSDSSLLINVYDRKEFDIKSYNKLLTDLKLPETVVKE